MAIAVVEVTVTDAVVDTASGADDGTRPPLRAGGVEVDRRIDDLAVFYRRAVSLVVVDLRAADKCSCVAFLLSGGADDGGADEAHVRDGSHDESAEETGMPVVALDVEVCDAVIAAVVVAAERAVVDGIVANGLERRTAKVDVGGLQEIHVIARMVGALGCAVAVGAGAVHIDGQVPQVAGTGDFVRISLRSLAVASGKERRISPRRRGGHREHYCEQRRGCPGNLSFRKVYSCHVLFNLVLTRQRYELLL